MAKTGLKGRLSRAMGKVSRKMRKLSGRKKKARMEECKSDTEVVKEPLVQQYLKEENSDFYLLKETLAQQALQAQDEKLALKESLSTCRPRPSGTRSKFVIEALRKEFVDAQEENVRLKNILRHRLTPGMAESVISTCRVPYIVTDARVEPASPTNVPATVTATATITATASAVTRSRSSSSTFDEDDSLSRRRASSHKDGGAPQTRRRLSSSSAEGEGKPVTITVSTHRRRRRSFRSRTLNQALPLEKSPSMERLDMVAPAATLASSALLLRSHCSNVSLEGKPWTKKEQLRTRRPQSPQEKPKQTQTNTKLTKKHESAARQLRTKFFIESLRWEFEERREENTKLKDLVRRSMPGEEAELVIARCNPLIASLTGQSDEPIPLTTTEPRPRTRPRRRRSFKSRSERRKSRTDDSGASVASFTSLETSQDGSEENENVQEEGALQRRPSQRELRDQEEGVHDSEARKLRSLLRDRMVELTGGGAINHDRTSMPAPLQQVRDFPASTTRIARSSHAGTKAENDLRTKFALEALRCEFYQRQEENAKLKRILRQVLPTAIAEGIIAHCSMQFVPEDLPSRDTRLEETTSDLVSRNLAQSMSISRRMTSSFRGRNSGTSELRTKFVLEGLRAEFHERQEENIKLKELLRRSLPSAMAQAIIARCSVEFVPAESSLSEEEVPSEAPLFTMPSPAIARRRTKKVVSEHRIKFVLEALRAEFHHRQSENVKLKEVIRRVFPPFMAEGIIDQCSVQFEERRSNHVDLSVASESEATNENTVAPRTMQRRAEVDYEIVPPVFIGTSPTPIPIESSSTYEDDDSSSRKRKPVRTSSLARLIERERSAVRVKYLIDALSHQFYDRKDENAALKRIIRTRFPSDHADMIIAQCTSDMPATPPPASPTQTSHSRRLSSSHHSSVSDSSSIDWPRRKKYGMRFKFVLEALRWEFHERQEENRRLKQLLRMALPRHLAEVVIAKCGSVDLANLTPPHPTLSLPRTLSSCDARQAPILPLLARSQFAPLQTAMGPPRNVDRKVSASQQKSELRMKFMIEAAAKEFDDCKEQNEGLKRILLTALPDQAASIISECTVPLSEMLRQT